jgi:hypothetical protein
VRQTVVVVSVGGMSLLCKDLSVVDLSQILRFFLKIFA